MTFFRSLAAARSILASESERNKIRSVSLVLSERKKPRASEENSSKRDKNIKNERFSKFFFNKIEFFNRILFRNFITRCFFYHTDKYFSLKNNEKSSERKNFERAKFSLERDLVRASEKNISLENWANEREKYSRFGVWLISNNLFEEFMKYFLKFSLARAFCFYLLFFKNIKKGLFWTIFFKELIKYFLKFSLARSFCLNILFFYFMQVSHTKDS